MAQVKVTKLSDTSGRPKEIDILADDITAASFTAGSVVLGSTGLDLATENISNAGDIGFDDPAVNTIEQTAGALIVDNIMAKERNNVMTTAGAILFPAIGDVAGELDAFQLPQSSALPTATPANNSNQGFLVSYNGRPYHWNGTSWDDLTTAASTQSVVNTFTAAVNIAAREVVYISGADSVSLADNDAEATSTVIGLAVSGASATNPVEVQSSGIMGGFSGLTPGAIYFLSNTAGAITATPPAGNSRETVQIGYAKSATELFIDIVWVSGQSA